MYSYRLRKFVYWSKLNKLDIFSPNDEIIQDNRKKALISSLDRRKTEEEAFEHILGTFFARNLLNDHLIINFPKKNDFILLNKNIFVNLFSCLQQSVVDLIFIILPFSSFFNIPIYVYIYRERVLTFHFWDK